MKEASMAGDSCRSDKPAPAYPGAGASWRRLPSRMDAAELGWRNALPAQEKAREIRGIAETKGVANAGDVEVGIRQQAAGFEMEAVVDHRLRAAAGFAAAAGIELLGRDTETPGIETDRLPVAEMGFDQFGEAFDAVPDPVLGGALGADSARAGKFDQDDTEDRHQHADPPRCAAGIFAMELLEA